MAKKSKKVPTPNDDSPKVMHLFVYIPTTIQYTTDEQKFPVLIYVDPDVKPDVLYQSHPNNSPSIITRCTDISATKIAGFNYMASIPLADLHPGMVYTLHVCASAGGHSPSHYCRKICHPKGNGYGGGSPPTIAYPPAGGDVGATFTACGYDNPVTTQVTGFVAVGGDNYPGTTLDSPPPPYDWAVSFSGLPAPTLPKTKTATLCIHANEPGLQTTESITLGNPQPSSC
jgi:hypothetical protein